MIRDSIFVAIASKFVANLYLNHFQSIQICLVIHNWSGGPDKKVIKN